MASHPTALIADDARVDAEAELGPYVIIGARSEIAAGCRLHPHVVVGDDVMLGPGVEAFSGAVLGRQPKGAGATARTPQQSSGLRIGSGCSIGAGAVLYYDVEIGDDCLVGDHASVREGARLGRRCLVSRSVTLNANVHLGVGVKVMDNTHLTGGTRVLDGAFVSTGVSTANDNRPLAELDGDDRLRGPLIGREVVIGAAATLLPGVQLADGCVVAAGAVVTRDVPAGATVAGVPARRHIAAPTRPAGELA